jgi:hypothetical protein
MKTQEKQAVIVTTAHRGIFFGYSSVDTEDAMRADIITLADARMIVYHSSDSHGVIGMGKRGPGTDARVSSNVTSLTLKSLTSVFPVTDDSKEKIEAEPWK